MDSNKNMNEAAPLLTGQAKDVSNANELERDDSITSTTPDKYSEATAHEPDFFSVHELGMANVSPEKITENVEDIVQDLENLLGESSDNYSFAKDSTVVDSSNEVNSSNEYNVLDSKLTSDKAKVANTTSVRDGEVLQLQSNTDLLTENVIQTSCTNVPEQSFEKSQLPGTDLVVGETIEQSNSQGIIHSDSNQKSYATGQIQINEVSTDTNAEETGGPLASKAIPCRSNDGVILCDEFERFQSSLTHSLIINTEALYENDSEIEEKQVFADTQMLTTTGTDQKSEMTKINYNTETNQAASGIEQVENPVSESHSVLDVSEVKIHEPNAISGNENKGESIEIETSEVSDIQGSNPSPVTSVTKATEHIPEADSDLENESVVQDAVVKTLPVTVDNHIKDPDSVAPSDEGHTLNTVETEVSIDKGDTGTAKTQHITGDSIQQVVVDQFHEVVKHIPSDSTEEVVDQLHKTVEGPDHNDNNHVVRNFPTGDEFADNGNVDNTNEIIEVRESETNNDICGSISAESETESSAEIAAIIPSINSGETDKGTTLPKLEIISESVVTKVAHKEEESVLIPNQYSSEIISELAETSDSMLECGSNNMCDQMTLQQAEDVTQLKPKIQSHNLFETTVELASKSYNNDQTSENLAQEEIPPLKSVDITVVSAEEIYNEKENDNILQKEILSYKATIEPAEENYKNDELIGDLSQEETPLKGFEVADELMEESYNNDEPSENLAQEAITPLKSFDITVVLAEERYNEQNDNLLQQEILSCKATVDPIEENYKNDEPIGNLSQEEIPLKGFEATGKPIDESYNNEKSGETISQEESFETTLELLEEPSQKLTQGVPTLKSCETIEEPIEENYNNDEASDNILQDVSPLKSFETLNELVGESCKPTETIFDEVPPFQGFETAAEPVEENCNNELSGNFPQDVPTFKTTEEPVKECYNNYEPSGILPQERIAPLQSFEIAAEPEKESCNSDSEHLSQDTDTHVHISAQEIGDEISEPTFDSGNTLVGDDEKSEVQTQEELNSITDNYYVGTLKLSPFQADVSTTYRSSAEVNLNNEYALPEKNSAQGNQMENTTTVEDVSESASSSKICYADELDCKPFNAQSDEFIISNENKQTVESRCLLEGENESILHDENRICTEPSKDCKVTNALFVEIIDESKNLVKIIKSETNSPNANTTELNVTHQAIEIDVSDSKYVASPEVFPELCTIEDATISSAAVHNSADDSTVTTTEENFAVSSIIHPTDIESNTSVELVESSSQYLQPNLIPESTSAVEALISAELYDNVVHSNTVETNMPVFGSSSQYKHSFMSNTIRTPKHFEPSVIELNCAVASILGETSNVVPEIDFVVSSETDVSTSSVMALDIDTRSEETNSFGINLIDSVQSTMQGVVASDFKQLGSCTLPDSQIESSIISEEFITHGDMALEIEEAARTSEGKHSALPEYPKIITPKKVPEQNALQSAELVHPLRVEELVTQSDMASVIEEAARTSEGKHSALPESPKKITTEKVSEQYILLPVELVHPLSAEESAEELITQSDMAPVIEEAARTSEGKHSALSESQKKISPEKLLGQNVLQPAELLHPLRVEVDEPITQSDMASVIEEAARTSEGKHSTMPESHKITPQKLPGQYILQPAKLVPPLRVAELITQSDMALVIEEATQTREGKHSALPESQKKIASEKVPGQNILQPAELAHPLRVEVEDNNFEEQRDNVTSTQTEKTDTIFEIASPESQKNRASLKITIGKNENLHSILKIYDPNEADSSKGEAVVPKITIKPILSPDEIPPSPKLIIKPIKSPELSNPKITIKPIKPEPITSIKIKLRPGKATPTSPKSHMKTLAEPGEVSHYSPKITIKPIIKPGENTEEIKTIIGRVELEKHIKIKLNSTEDSDYLEERHSSPKLTIKPIIKPIDEEFPTSPRITIKPILKSPEEVQYNEEKPKITIKPVTKSHDVYHFTEEVPKITIKPIRKSLDEAHIIQEKAKITLKSIMKSSDEPHFTEDKPKITIKPIIKSPEGVHFHEDIPKITIKPVMKSPEGSHSPKITIKSVIKPEELASSSEEKHSPRITIKPVLKSPEHENVHSSRITFKSVKPPEDIKEPAGDACSVQPLKLNIKPVIKPPETSILQSFLNSGELPIKSPELIDFEDQIKQERIVLKIAKPAARRGRPPLSEAAKAANSLKLKLAKDAARLQALQSSLKRPLSAERQQDFKHLKTEILQDDPMSSDMTNSSITPQTDVIPQQASEIHHTGIKEEFPDPLAEIPIFEITPQSISATAMPEPHPQPQLIPMISTPAPGPRKRGRPRKVPLQVREEFKDPQEDEVQTVKQEENLENLDDSLRPKRSCRGPYMRSALGSRPRKPRGSRGGRGGSSSRGSRAKTPRRPKASKIVAAPFNLFPEPMVTDSECDIKDGEFKPVPLPTETGNNNREVVIYEEETRMSAENSSRAQTPAKQVLSSTEVIEESQSSVQSNATTESGEKTHKSRKGPRLPDHQEPEGEVLSADKLAEYSWGGGGPYMLQEQVAQFLGIKSFKRKYPGIHRRPVDMQERDFIRESCLASEPMCDMGLTAVKSEDILDIMYTDFQNKYEEYCKHQRDRQAKDVSNKQKALSLAASQEKNKIDIVEQAIQSAYQWNTNFNKARHEERRACMDLQTFTVHYPKGKMKQINKAPIGSYPLSLVPGQYSDYYKKYSARELTNLPLNTVGCGSNVEVDDSQSEGSGSDSDSSSSGSDSSSSGSSDDCKVCNSRSATPKKQLVR